MALSASVSMPKLNPNTGYTFSLAAGSVVENAGGRSWLSPRTATVNPPTFIVSGTMVTSGGTTTVTASTANGFADVEVGDAVSISSGNSSGATLTPTTVASKADDSTIVLTDAASVDGAGATLLDVNPPQITPAIYSIKEVHTYSGSAIKVEVWLYEYDGTLGSTAGTEGNATTTTKIHEFVINGATYLQNLRIMKSDEDTVAL